MNDKYILEGKNAVLVEDVLEWGKWFEKAGKKRVVKQTELKNGKYVSTVFLGLDYGFEKGKPLIFETMVFSKRRMKRKIFGHFRWGLGEELDMNRYSTWEEAEKGHKEMVKKWSKII